MKKYLFLIAALALLISGCATMSNSSSLTCTPEIRKLSNADDRLFSDLLTQMGGVGFADESSFPEAKTRTLENIMVIVPYDNHQTGVERWTIEHDNPDDTASYTVKLIPDGHNGTTFSVQKEKEPTQP